MALFGKKGDDENNSKNPPTDIPTDLIIQMRQQGTTNNQIMQDLQNRGYSPIQVSDAMSQADIKGTMENNNPGMDMANPGQQQQMGGAGMPPPPQGMPPPPMQPGNDMNSMPPPNTPYDSMNNYTPSINNNAMNDSSKQTMEEIAEGIIDEKWEELMKSVDKIIAWKDKADRKIERMEQKITDLKERFENLHSGILGKVEEYDKGIKTVGSDIKAMESVFKKIIPSFTENVGKLSRIATSMDNKSSKKSTKKRKLEDSIDEDDE